MLLVYVYGMMGSQSRIYIYIYTSPSRTTWSGGLGGGPKWITPAKLYRGQAFFLSLPFPFLFFSVLFASLPSPRGLPGNLPTHLTLPYLYPIYSHLSIPSIYICLLYIPSPCSALLPPDTDRKFAFTGPLRRGRGQSAKSPAKVSS